MNKDYFLNLMASRRMSMRALSQRMNMNHSQMSLTLSGQRKLQLDEAATLSHVFGVPIQEVIINAGVAVRPVFGRRISVVGYVGKGGIVVPNPPEIVERTDAPMDVPDDTVAVQFRTAGTPLDWADGWIAFYVRGEALDPEAIGRLSCCSIRDGATVVATIKRGYQPGTFNLSGFYNAQNVSLDRATPVTFLKT